ncbi:MAG: hypothetical protein GY936_19265 [Ignavibacteriae bacterium]|nr:hypothetical protein [Ignavibacteriota bacterium]
MILLLNPEHLLLVPIFLIEDDGTQGIGIKAKPGDYFLVIKHRNHLGVTTNLLQTGLTWGG